MTLRGPLLLLVAVAATACGDGPSAAEITAPPPGDARGVALVAEALAFDPDTLTVDAGGDIAVTLRSGDIAHDLTLDETDFHLHVEGGDTGTARLRIDTPGTYTAYCSIPGHREAGMELTIQVTS